MPQFPIVSRGHPSLDSLVKTLYIYQGYLKYAKMFALKKIIRRRRRILCTLELTVSLDTSHYLFEPNAGIGRRSSSKKKQGRPPFFVLKLDFATLSTPFQLIQDKPLPSTSAVLRSFRRICHQCQEHPWHILPPVPLVLLILVANFQEHNQTADA